MTCTDTLRKTIQDFTKQKKEKLSIDSYTMNPTRSVLQCLYPALCLHFRNISTYSRCFYMSTFGPIDNGKRSGFYFVVFLICSQSVRVFDRDRGELHTHKQDESMYSQQILHNVPLRSECHNIFSMTSMSRQILLKPA